MSIFEHRITFSVAYLLLIILILIHESNCTIAIISPHRQNAKIYTPLDATHMCFRRMNGTHQIGCSSPDFGGSSGIAIQIDDEQDHDNRNLDTILTAGRDAPYIVIVTLPQFGNLTLLGALRQAAIAANRVAGILILDNGTRPAGGYTPDRSCPNVYASVYRNRSDFGSCEAQRWNLGGRDPDDPDAITENGIAFNDYPFPIFLLRNRTQIEELQGKMKQFAANGGYPRLALQLSSPMTGARDSLTCLRRTTLMAYALTPEIYCDPLNGQNIFHHTIDLSERMQTKKIPDDSIVVVAARHDSFSMFEGLSPGADSAISSLVTLLALAQFMHQEPEIKREHRTKDLMFAIFDGESWDYLGSSDTVYQIMRGSFLLADPTRVDESILARRQLALSHFSHFIELNQIAPHRAGRNLIMLHKHYHPDSSGKIADLERLFLAEVTGLESLEVKFYDHRNQSSHPLPPSSAQSFLKKRILPAVVIASHQAQYTNRYYNSIYDDESIGDLDNLARNLTEVVTLLARVIFKLTTDEYLIPTVRANETLVRGLLECYLTNSNCQLFRAVLEPDRIISERDEKMAPFPTYTTAYPAAKLLREYTRHLLFWFTGETVARAVNRTECETIAGRNDQPEGFRWMAGIDNSGDDPKPLGDCIRSSAYKLIAGSPAINAQTFEIIAENLPDYPAIWTESRWRDISIRMFVVPSATYETIILVLGVIIVFVSFVATHYFDSHADQWFADPMNPKKGSAAAAANGKPSQTELVAPLTPPLAANRITVSIGQ